MLGMTRRRWIILVGLPLLVLIVGPALYFALSWAIVEQALVAEAKPFEQTPEELGLQYEDVAFAPRGWDDITLRGWYFPNPDAAATVVFVHGLDGTRSGDLELVGDLLGQGFAALTFDLRGHGESDKAQMGAALHEQDDVLGAVDFVLSERGAVPGRVFLLGFSYGAAIVLLTGVREPAVAGVYADSAFADLTDLLVKEVSDRTPVPRWGARLLRPGIIRTARWVKGIDIVLVRPELAVPRSDCKPRTDRSPSKLVEQQSISLGIANGQVWNVVFSGCRPSEASELAVIIQHILEALLLCSELFVIPTLSPP